MLSNYLTIALRSLAKQRLFTVLNIVGLAVGLSAGLLVLLWVQDERSFDRFHPDAERIYREIALFKSGDNLQAWETSPAPHAVYALREIPGVEHAVRVNGAGESLVQYEQVSQMEKEGAFVDTAFFQVFKTEMLAGSKLRPFGDVNSVVLTETLARKYFGAVSDWSSVLGRVLQFDQKPLQVSGVLRDLPDNTALQFSYFRPYEYLKVNFTPNDYWKSLEEDWGDFNGTTYFKLRPDADYATVGRLLGDIHHKHNSFDNGSFYQLQPLTEAHLHAADGADAGAQTVQIMGLAALFILLIACINYVNLATAKATQRALEVGLRKAIGANRRQLIAQFLVESGLVFLIASGLALLITHLLLPYCNQLADKHLALDWRQPEVLYLLGGVLVGTLALSAVYPALVLSAFSPLNAMQGRSASTRDGQASLRKGLVVVQFACSAALLFSMLVIGQQMDYIRSKNLGYERENVLAIALSEATYKNRKAMEEELKTSPGVLSVTTASGNLMRIGSTTGDTDWEGKTTGPSMIISPLAVAPDFLDFFKMNLVAGRGFTGTKADSTSFIVNEAAVAQMGLTDPVGKRFKLWQTEGSIVGVVKNFHFASLRETIKPAVFLANPEWAGVIYVKTTGAGASQAVAAAQGLWQRFDPKYPFDYKFLDDSFDKMYRREQRTTSLFKAFSAIALLVSCLGLFGLSAFTVQKRQKEIGIRKVLGASVLSITNLLTVDFLKLVAVAITLASPAAYFLMRAWLSDFAYRVDIQWWMFLLAGAMAVTVALLTVSFQSVKAALSNPVKALKSE